jgi:hypothetical protein
MSQFGFMKRITNAGENLITSNEIAERLVSYAVRVSQLGTSSAVRIPVLESNGTVAQHTLVINAATQLDIVDVDGITAGSETDRFGEAEFPPLETRPVVEPINHQPAVGEFDEYGGSPAH